jgi:CRISPR-associated protein Cmr2
MSGKILHFTIGPVQGFVAQARRTRDFWAGSFLLSWLSGQAMAATLKNGGAIEFPDVGTLDAPSDPLLAAILGQPLADHATPDIGSIPNRFKATVPAGFDPAVIRQHVQQKWSDLADAVWRDFIEKVESKGRDTKHIWDRQILTFWDMQWVVGDRGTEEVVSKLDGGWLDLRKNWRSHWPAEGEGGDHCTIMGDWQELSGRMRSLKHERELQDQFWQALQGNKRLGRLELRDGERLCAIALVKRLFPKLSQPSLEKTIGWTPGGRAEMLSNWPSTAYMAALPWLIHIADDERGERQGVLHKYFAEVNQRTSKSDTFKKLTSERATLIPKLESLRTSAFEIDQRHPDSLDGNLFLEDALANARITPLSDEPAVIRADGTIQDPDEEIRNELLKALAACNKNVNANAPVFYALLIFDGDNLGKLLQRPEPEFDNAKISQALAAFTRQVDPIVSRHAGVTMYAGGDDVLALLPITTAIECASALRDVYGNASAKLFAPPQAAEMTGSAAVVFAHFHLPLRDVIREGHEQLDKVAKDGNGRNSLALSLFKPGGVTGRWVGNIEQMPARWLEFQKLIADDKLATSFFYNLRTRYPMLARKQAVDSGLDAKSVLLAEYCKGREFKSADERAHAEAHVQAMLDACCYHRGETGKLPDATRGLQIGGAMIARFIVEYGIHLGRRQGL